MSQATFQRETPAWHPAVIHTCRVETPRYADTAAYHVALRPRRIGETPMMDLEDVGYRVVTRGLFAGDVPHCDLGKWPRCGHAIVKTE